MKQIEHGLLYLKNLILSIMVLLLVLEAIRLLPTGHSLFIGWSLVSCALIVTISTYCNFSIKEKRVENKKIFKRQLEMNKQIWLTFIKNVGLFLLIWGLIIISVGASIYYKITIMEINLSLWIIGYFICFFFSFLLHFFTYRLTLKKLEVESIPLKKIFLKYVSNNKNLVTLGILSPDYMFADLYKKVLDYNYDNNSCEKRSGYCKHLYGHREFNCELIEDLYECEIHEKKRKRKLFIIYNNWANLIVTSYLTIFFIFNLQEGFIPKYFMSFITVIIIIHTLSRVIEIIYAFYSDVVSSRMSSSLDFDERKSNLKKGNRISLAIHSYIEVILLFALIYRLIENLSEKLNEEYINTIFYSFSVSAFNVSFTESSYTFDNFFYVVQVGTSMTLVILALASYLGIQDKMNEYEKSDWKNKKYI